MRGDTLASKSGSILHKAHKIHYSKHHSQSLWPNGAKTQIAEHGMMIAQPLIYKMFHIFLFLPICNESENVNDVLVLQFAPQIGALLTLHIKKANDLLSADTVLLNSNL